MEDQMEVVSCLALPLIAVGAIAAIMIWKNAPRLLSRLQQYSPMIPRVAAVATIAVVGYLAVTNIEFVPCGGSSAQAAEMPAADCGCLLN
jgi:hypothetical protein